MHYGRRIRAPICAVDTKGRYMEIPKTSFEEVMAAWRYAGGSFKREQKLAVMLRQPEAKEYGIEDLRVSTPAFRHAVFAYALCSYRDERSRLHSVHVVFDENSGYIVSSSHGLEGYRMKDGFPDASFPRLASDGSLVFEPARSEA
jgi:hypothetical protein